MKRIIALTLLLALIPSAASAKEYKTTFAKDGAPMVTKPFGSFGNYQVGDCQYETEANLVLNEWPTSVITTQDVLGAYYANGEDAAQNFFLSTGFDGHRASAVTPIFNRTQIIYAADHGGVEVVQTDGLLSHMFAMIRANSRQVTLVNEGIVYIFPWWYFLKVYDSSGSSLTYYAVTWKG